MSKKDEAVAEAENQQPTAVAEKADQLPAKPEDMLANLLGHQNENADADSYAIPFLKILQSNSPIVDPEHPEHTAEHVQGRWCNTITSEVFKEVEVVPIYFVREMIEWKLNRGGYVARYKPTDPYVLQAKPSEIDGKIVNLSLNGHSLQDTRQHYVMLINGDKITPMLLPLSSTQIKKSKRIMMLIDEHKAAGKLMSFKLGTSKESNDAGSWYGVTVAVGTDQSGNVELLTKANEFMEALRSGNVTIDEEQFGPDSGGSSGGATPANDAALGEDDIPF